jgi:predicted translin family RNA/ssDNA-binding protein
VGELKRVIIDSMNRADSVFAKDVFKIMQEMFNKLEEFTQFSNSFSFSNRRNYSDPESGSKHQSDLKQKIDVARYAVNNARKLLG